MHGTAHERVMVRWDVEQLSLQSLAGSRRIYTWMASRELTAAAQRAGKIVPARDGLIAATARRHGLHVMTRNTEHFVPTGVLLLNPWTDHKP